MKKKTSEGDGQANLRRRIEAKAHEIYLKRVGKGIPGDAVSDWTEAERELSGTSKKK